MLFIGGAGEVEPLREADRIPELVGGWWSRACWSLGLLGISFEGGPGEADSRQQRATWWVAVLRGIDATMLIVSAARKRDEVKK